MGSATFWISFLDLSFPFRPPGEKFLGALIISGATDAEAVETARRLGLHPGGTAFATMVLGVEIPADMQNRLLASDEARNLARLIEWRAGGRPN